MNNPDYGKLNRKALIELFEQERQKWLDAGMNEADIYRVHFGEENENGHGGDYGYWLSERSQIRPDHKYAPGMPTTFEEADPDSVWIRDNRDDLADLETQVDFEIALSHLTKLQRFCFVEVELNDRTQQSVADELGTTQQMIFKHIEAAKKKIKKFFQG